MLQPLVASNIISKILECSICSQQMSEPKMLTCQHTFCLKCIIEVAADCLKPMQCPICLRKYYLTYSEAKELPNNLTIIALIEMNKTNKAVLESETISTEDQNISRLVDEDSDLEDGETPQFEFSPPMEVSLPENIPSNFAEDQNISWLSIMPEIIPSKCSNPDHQNEITVDEVRFCNLYPVDALQNCFQREIFNPM